MAKGVQLWAENGELRYAAPRGALTPQEILKIRQHKNKIVEHLVATREDADPLARAGVSHLRSMPLAFSQLAHWNSQRLGERRVIRGVAFGDAAAGSAEHRLVTGCHNGGHSPA